MNLSHQILVGDSLALLRTLPDKSVHCCVTSPPYYGLRDYGVDGQIGLEQTPAEFIARLVEVFREVRRVLRDDGTCWVNMGDSYSSGGRTWRAPDSKAPGARAMSTRPNDGMKPKDLLGMPWRLAFALQDDGWYLRQDIIWHKPNPMPESVRDRCTKAHEYLFLLSKSRRYYFDSEAIREPATWGATPTGVGFGHGTDADARDRTRITVPKGWDTSVGEGGHGGFQKDGSDRGSKRNSFARKTKYSDGNHGQKGQHRPDRPDVDYGLTRNKRSVWSVATFGYKGAHFATFPPELIRPCILAGAARGGLVLDPFGGAATTALVAMQEGRRSILCELNPEYAAIGRARLADAWASGGAQLDIFNDHKGSAAWRR